MLEAYVGRVGSGKTYAMVERALRLRGKVPMYSNMGLSWAEQFRSWEDLCGLSNGVVLLDEAGVWFSSRFYKSLPPEVLSMILQSRKRGLQVWATTQSLEGVDVVLRRNFAFVHRCERFGPLLRVTTVSPEGERYYARWSVVSKRVYAEYDTFEVIGDREGGEGNQRGRGALARVEWEVRRAMAEGWVLEEDAEMGRSWWRRPELADLVQGRVCVPGAGGWCEWVCSEPALWEEWCRGRVVAADQVAV